MESTTLRYGLGKVHPGGPEVPPKRPFWGHFLYPKPPPKNANFTLSSLRLIGRLSDILYARDQGLSKYAKIVGNGVDYPAIWRKHGRAANFFFRGSESETTV